MDFNLFLHFGLEIQIAVNMDPNCFISLLFSPSHHAGKVSVLRTGIKKEEKRQQFYSFCYGLEMETWQKAC